MDDDMGRGAKDPLSPVDFPGDTSIASEGKESPATEAAREVQNVGLGPIKWGRVGEAGQVDILGRGAEDPALGREVPADSHGSSIHSGSRRRAKPVGAR